MSLAFHKQSIPLNYLLNPRLSSPSSSSIYDVSKQTSHAHLFNFSQNRPPQKRDSRNYALFIMAGVKLHGNVSSGSLDDNLKNYYFRPAQPKLIYEIVAEKAFHSPPTLQRKAVTLLIFV